MQREILSNYGWEHPQDSDYDPELDHPHDWPQLRIDERPCFPLALEQPTHALLSWEYMKPGDWWQYLLDMANYHQEYWT